jgi:membrane protease YdiL (CAAX protease family)
MTWPVAVGLHLGPGVAVLLCFVVSAPLLHRAGLPPVWGLLAGTLLVMAPLELALARRLAATGDGRLGASPASVDQRLSRSDVGALLLAASLSGLAPGLVVWLEPRWRERLFSWLPEWFVASPGDLGDYSSTMAGVTVVLWLLSNVLVGPAVEEVYFRGFLLPRLPAGRLVACTANSALFAVYHLWQPQAVLTIFVFSLPLALLVSVRGKPVLAVLVHCGVNAAAFVVLFSGVFAR